MYGYQVLKRRAKTYKLKYTSAKRVCEKVAPLKMQEFLDELMEFIEIAKQYKVPYRRLIALISKYYFS